MVMQYSLEIVVIKIDFFSATSVWRFLLWLVLGTIKIGVKCIIKLIEKSYIIMYLTVGVKLLNSSPTSEALYINI